MDAPESLDLKRTAMKIQLGVCAVAFGLAAWQAAPAQSLPLPRFTEEREAAALFFVKKHLAEMVPVLDQLKKDKVEHYQKEVSEIFQVTEILADLREDMARHDLEL